MRKRWMILSSTLVLGAFLGTSLALRAQPQLSAEMHAVLLTYLFEDCGSGEVDPAVSLKAVVEFGREAVPFLLRAVAVGPSPELEAELDRDARADFERRRRFLEEENGLSGLKEQDVREQALAQTEAEYVERRVRSFDSSYRQRALNALVAIGPEYVVEDLRTVGDSAEDADLRKWIEDAVRKLSGGQ